MQNELSDEQKQVLEMCHRVIREIKKVIIGKDDIIIKVLLSVLAGGHVLIEDIPGVGKTTLALALSKALSLEYKRVQFTPDVLPSDLTGFMALNKKRANLSTRAALHSQTFSSPTRSTVLPRKRSRHCWR